MSQFLKKIYGLTLALQILVGQFCHESQASEDQTAPQIDFAKEILPLLSDRCFACHGPDHANRKAELRLDRQEDALSSGVIEPGNPDASELIARITSSDHDEVMPPPKFNKKLSQVEVQRLREWIKQGAKWSTHWAWQKPRRPELPKVTNADLVRNPVDQFVLAKLEEQGMSFQPEADKPGLARRAALDLTGLPPEKKSLQEFLNDTSTNAFEKYVDKLLASPRFGERMAWDWLDAARYADTNGYQGDADRTMWPWRDWVIQAFNSDMPFNQFTVDQLAGDLLSEPSRDQILATGFNRNHMINGEGGRIAEENRVEYVFDQAETVSTVWLGLTMTCARCHDHKFDPVSQRDYYQFFAFFNQSPVNGAGGSGQTAPVLDMATADQVAEQKKTAAAYGEHLKKVQAKESQLREAGMVIKDGVYSTTLPVIIESTLRKGPNDRAAQNYEELYQYYGQSEPAYVEDLKKLRELRKSRDEAASRIVKVMVMADMPKPRETFVLTRGSYDKHESPVSPQLLSAFTPSSESDPKATEKPETRLNRLDLAQWVISPENPLTSRVTVNRIWQMLFGSGLVKTTEDFGLQGQLPSHPELLDFLAAEFQNPKLDESSQPWSLKHLIRLIVTSATYRQSSSAPEGLWMSDPENRLLARGPRHRLPSWMIRDQALSVAGLMTPDMGGPSVNSYQPSGIWEEATFGNKSYRQDHGRALYRRSLYLFWRRIVGPTVFFDNANRQTCSVKSVITNTPLHALTTLNDITYVEAARVLAQNLLNSGTDSEADRIAWLIHRTLMRQPTPKETVLFSEALKRQIQHFQSDPMAAQALVRTGEYPADTALDPVEHAAWTQVCLLVLNLDEFLSKP